MDFVIAKHYVLVWAGRLILLVRLDVCRCSSLCAQLEPVLDRRTVAVRVSWARRHRARSS